MVDLLDVHYALGRQKLQAGQTFITWYMLGGSRMLNIAIAEAG